MRAPLVPVSWAPSSSLVSAVTLSCDNWPVFQPISNLPSAGTYVLDFSRGPPNFLMLFRLTAYDLTGSVLGYASVPLQVLNAIQSSMLM